MHDLIKLVLNNGRTIVERGRIMNWGVKIEPARGVFVIYPWQRINGCVQISEEIIEHSEFGGDPIVRSRSADEMNSLAEAFTEAAPALQGDYR